MGDDFETLVLFLDEQDDELEQLGRQRFESVLWRALQPVPRTGIAVRGRFFRGGHGAGGGRRGIRWTVRRSSSTFNG